MNLAIRTTACLLGLLILSPTFAQEQVSVGGNDLCCYEFRASTFTLSSQSEAALDADPVGNLIAVWSSRRQQEGHYGVYAQRFTPEGIALGTETQVNLWTDSHQMRPDVATDKRGNTWIVWQSHGQDGHAGAIVARRFDADFVGGSEILVNQQWRGHQYNPIVNASPNGQALIVWNSTCDPKQPPTLRARLLNSDGKPLCDEFAVRLDTQTATRVAAATFAPNGEFAIAYSVFSKENRPAGIFMQRFAADARLLGDEINVCGESKNSQIEPVIAATDDGYIVAWLDAESDGDDYGVLARRFKHDGNPLGTAFVVNRTRTGPQTAAAIAVNPAGGFTIAWNSGDGDKAGIFAQAFTSEGTSLGTEFRVNQYTKGPQALRGAACTHRLVYLNCDNPTLACAWNGDADQGDKSSVNITLLTDQPLTLAESRQGVTPEMKPADPKSILAAEPHRPPTFNPEDIDAGQREIQRGPSEFGFTAITSTGWTPPDPHAAAGPEHIVAMTNGAIAFFTKNGLLTFQDQIEGSGGFWGGLGTSGFVFDPEVLYDELSGRFFAMAAEAYAPPGDSHSYVLVAVSDDSNPNGVWHKYRFDTTTLAGDLFDSPNIAVDQDAVYITGDGFGYGANYPIYIFDKASLLVGNPPIVTNSLTLSTNTQSAGIPPVTDDSGLLYMIEHGEGWTGDTSVRLIALRNGLGAPVITTTSLTVPFYTSPEDPPQAGTSTRPNTFDARFWSAAYRNGSLWGTHHVNASRVRARWYEVAMNGWPLSGQLPELVQSGEIDPGGSVRTFFSSISVDDLGNAAMTFARSAPDEYISMGTAYRLHCDPLNTFRTDVIQKSSTSPDTSGRWGDYSAITPDPARPLTFWAYHEYTSGYWQTWIARITVDDCATPGDFDGDGDVDLSDLAHLLASYGTDDGGDLDGDGDTDLADLALLLSNYGV